MALEGACGVGGDFTPGEKGSRVLETAEKHRLHPLQGLHRTGGVLGKRFSVLSFPTSGKFGMSWVTVIFQPRLGRSHQQAERRWLDGPW